MKRSRTRVDPDLLAVVVLEHRPPDPTSPSSHRGTGRRTNRHALQPVRGAGRRARGLTAGAATEGALLVPVLRDVHRRLLARLTQQADRLQNADRATAPNCGAGPTRQPEDRDGVPATAVPRVDGLQHDDLPLRDFDTTGAGGLPAETASGVDGTLLVLATRSDDPLAWLECGEAMQRVLLELTAQGWAVRPFTQLIEVPLTRTQLRSALAWDAHPQLILRIGHAEPTPPTPRRRVSEVVLNAR